MKNIIKDLIKESLYKINKDKNISIENIEVNLCKDKKFGDFSSNVAMRYSHVYDAKPKVFAEEIIKGIKEDKNILGHLFIVCKNLAKELNIEKSGCQILTNVEEGGGQTVMHLHLHLLSGNTLKL